MKLIQVSIPPIGMWRYASFLVVLLTLILPGCRTPRLASSLASPDNDNAAGAAMRPTLSEKSPQSASFPQLPAPEFQGSTIHTSGVQQVAFDDSKPVLKKQSSPLPAAANARLAGETYSLDLPTALELAGADNLQIAFAAERVEQAIASMDQASVLWVPSINVGLIYNNHAGRIQETEGGVIEVSRNSLFVGAGAKTAFSPTAGGSSGPARMVVDMPLVDALFEPLAARQVVRAAEANETTTFNDTLLQVTVAYLNLLHAHSQVAIAQETFDNAARLARITADFARAGEGLEADAERLQAELNSRRRDLLLAKEQVAVASAEVVRLLRLDSCVIVVPTDRQVAPINIVEEDKALCDLIETALACRPELDRVDAVADETGLRAQQERIRPWLPNVYAGFSGGGFGGGPGGSVSSFSDRTDFDLGAVWELQNFGWGNAARVRKQQSIHYQALLASEQTRDLIASEVSRAFHQVQLRRQQIGTTRSQVRSAQRALQLNLEGIRARALRAIEAQQAITALASARGQYLDSVISFNRAQFELLRAIGEPIYEDSGQ